MTALLHKIAPVVFAGLLIILPRPASGQECCPISDALSKPLPPLAPRVTEPLPYQFNVTTYPLAQFRQIGLPYPIVYRGQRYEFTGLVVGGEPIYRRMTDGSDVQVYRGQSYEFTGLVVGGQPIYRRTP